MKRKVTVLGQYLWLVMFLAVGFVVCMLCSCKTQYVPVETIREVYVTKTDTFIKKDSVFCHDSVFVHSKGDTVWYEKWHTKYVDRWRDRVSIDTIIKKDSIQVPYPVERELTEWEKIKMDYGAIAVGGTVLAVIMVILQFVRWLRRRDI